MRTALRVFRRFQASSVTPAMADIPSVWRTLPQEQRATIVKDLDTKMTADWKTLSQDEKRASYYIYFGPHGPRDPQKTNTTTVFMGVAGVIAVAAGLSVLMRKGGQETPHTMTKEWQEKTNELMKAQKANPFSGIASPEYQGKGFIQSN